MKVVIVALMFVLANTVMAGTTHYEDATIKSVDEDSNTFTVQLDDSGLTKTYSFPESIYFTDEGVALIDKSAFKPGQSVKLKFEIERSSIANPGNRAEKEYTLKGMTVD